MLRELPTEAALAELNKAHAPNWMGHTLLQRVYHQMNNDCVEALREGDQTKAMQLSSVAQKLEPLAFAVDFQAAYDAALDL